MKQLLLTLVLALPMLADGPAVTLPATAGPVYTAGAIELHFLGVPLSVRLLLPGGNITRPGQDVLTVWAVTKDPNVTGFVFTILSASQKQSCDAPIVWVPGRDSAAAGCTFYLDSLASLKRISTEEKRASATLEIQF